MTNDELIIELLADLPTNGAEQIQAVHIRTFLEKLINRSELRKAIGINTGEIVVEDVQLLLKSDSNNEIYARVLLNSITGDEGVDVFSEDSVNGTSALIRVRSNGNINLNSSSTIDLYSADVIQIFAENSLNLTAVDATLSFSNAVSLGTNDFYFEASNSGQRLYLFSNDLIRNEALNKIESFVFGGQVKTTLNGTDLSIKLEVSPTEFIRIANGDVMQLHASAIELVSQTSVYIQGESAGLYTGFGQVEVNSEGVRISRTGGQHIRFSNVPVFPDHATADASVLSEAIYKLTGDRTIYQKP